MASDEFSIIDRYFSAVGKSAYRSRLTIGDDAAIVDVPADRQLVMSMDTLNSGVHFPQGADPADLACKALAVNLSDLAAMAAEPAWFLLSLTLPEIDEHWLQRFSDSLKQTAQTYQVELIGGDTCRGPLSITIQIAGLVPRDCYVTRAQARPGDLVVVSGELGNAALGLAHLQQKIQLPDDLQALCLASLNRPRPRLELTPFLSAFATAAIDLSDGLLGDLQHILAASGVGALIKRDHLPVNHWIRRHLAYEYALTGGDDYEICCTLAAARLGEVETWNQANPHCQLSVIGEITESGFYLQQGDALIDLSGSRGYQHFA